MRLCLFEDSRVASLEPIALTRPAFALRCGAGAILERHARLAPHAELGAVVRPHLAEICRHEHPNLSCNDAAWLRPDTVYVNARWLPSAALDSSEPRVGIVDDEIAYIVGAPAPCPVEDGEA